MRRDASGQEKAAGTMPVRQRDTGFVAAVAGLFLPVLFFAVYIPVSLFVGDVLPGAVLYVVLLVGLATMGVGISLARLRLWQKLFLFGVFASAYAVEIIGIALLAMSLFGFEGVF